MSRAHIHLSSGQYYAYPKEIGTVPFVLPAKLSPVTVIAGTEVRITGSWLENVISSFEIKDDVFSRVFLATIIFIQSTPQPASTKPELDDGAFEVLDELGVNQYKFGGYQQWPQGPYFVEGRTLYEAWKLYPGTSEVFYLTTVLDPEDSSSYIPLNTTAFAPVNSVAVPSRLYFERTSEKPLHGLRAAIKDIYDLKGVKTAGSSRSYNQLYPARAQSAPLVQIVIDKGAIIVGKTKTTTFADREIPTDDWIDIHAPFNPRGDGYLVPGGSSAGSGAALASYDWLDIAIGTDMSGSIRWPAAYSGLYGFKPTLGAAAMNGIIPSSL